MFTLFSNNIPNCPKPPPPCRPNRPIRVPTSGGTELCSPNCSPNCAPCSPSSRTAIEWLYKLLLAVTPVVLNPVFSNAAAGYLVYESLNEISGSGLPDYYAHNRVTAPSIVRLAQDYNLLMSVNTPKQHHATPVMNYAYFNPLTNVLLDKSNFWPLYKNYVLLSTDKKYTPVPFNKNIQI